MVFAKGFMNWPDVFQNQIFYICFVPVLVCFNVCCAFDIGSFSLAPLITYGYMKDNEK